MSAAFDADPAQVVLRIATTLVADPHRVLDWYHGDGIASLGGFTAAQLVAAGHVAGVLAFLHGVLAAEDGAGGAG
ncbi:MAG TPA: hypothetical protein DDZ67_08140 [Xanthomonadaceae bacterium]|nr:hypothetical protein [Xanthomonadaceae bacterium]